MAVKLVTLPNVTLTNSGQAYQIYEQTLAVTSVTVQAEFTNSAKIALGGSTVTTSTGVEIPPGDTATIQADAASGRSAEEFYLSDIYACSSSAGQVIRVTAFTRKV
jgi:hypothetical protein